MGFCEWLLGGGMELFVLWKLSFEQPQSSPWTHRHFTGLGRANRGCSSHREPVADVPPSFRQEQRRETIRRDKYKNITELHVTLFKAQSNLFSLWYKKLREIFIMSKWKTHSYHVLDHQWHSKMLFEIPSKVSFSSILSRVCYNMWWQQSESENWICFSKHCERGSPNTLWG